MKKQWKKENLRRVVSNIFYRTGKYWRLTKTIIVLCPVCDETRSSYDEIEKHLEADHNAQPEIANLIIKMVQELQQMITKNNELKRELNDLREMLKASVKGSNLETSGSTP